LRNEHKIVVRKTAQNPLLRKTQRQMVGQVKQPSSTPYTLPMPDNSHLSFTLTTMPKQLNDHRWPRLTALTVSIIYTCTIN